MQKKLTNKQKAVLDYLRNYISGKGYPPTIREIASEIGAKSPSTAQMYLETLIEKGYIERDPTKPRAITIVDAEHNSMASNDNWFIDIPVLGSISDEKSFFSQENIKDYFSAPTEAVRDKDCFMLIAKGSSMEKAAIYDGDRVIASRQSNAEDGDIVIALIGDMATVKRFYKEDNGYRLQPENDSMEPIILNKATILGRVVGVVRDMR